MLIYNYEVIKINKIKFISLLLILASALSLASCIGKVPTEESTSIETYLTEETTARVEEETKNEDISSEDQTEYNSDTEKAGDMNTETGEESSSTAETEEMTKAELSGKHAELIELSNSLANGVQARFSDYAWNSFIIENQNMTLEYFISSSGEQLVTYLSSKSGNKYFENTADVFVTMEDGMTYYASQSTEDAVINVTKFGYYYNEIRAEYQNFSFLGEKRQTLDNLSLARIFHTYSDKLHVEAQIAASEATSGIVAIGFKTEISSDTVEKLVVKDADGLHYSLDDVDWSTAEYIGFDIKTAGIFGYILPYDSADALSVTLEGESYVIIQSRSPENNAVMSGNGSPYYRDGKIGNGNDFYIGHRLYTDEKHDFDDFLIEAYIERNPLGNDRIKVFTETSDEGAFEGYDSLRGSYIFSLDGNTEGRDQYSFYPNRSFNLNFAIKGDEHERTLYTVVYTDRVSHSDFGSLECAVLLDDDKLLLPVPIEVGKNFGLDMDVNVFDLLDLPYGEAILPLIASPDETNEYNLVHLYQNWGNFPLKQISYIEYHSPYYHLSTGLTETNCIVPWKFTSERAISNLLPDHRGMSAPLWSNGPQHTQSGVHSFLEYTATRNGEQVGELYSQTIDSYGPIYSDITMNHLSTDGKIKISYTHIEMPQLDENRAYYIMEYEFLEDVTVKYFTKNFIFYSVGSNEWPKLYKQFSYLDENNEPQIKNFSDIPSSCVFTLGSDRPYFSAFDLNVSNYGNVSLLVYSSEVIIGGEKQDVNFALRRDGGSLCLTLDLENVSFKMGDKITVNAIIMPWGSQKSNYSGKKYAPDQNVRDVRENSLLNPIVATAGDNTKVIDSVFIPKLKTTNGKSAEFTISGGSVSKYKIPYREKGYNVAVRVYGFDTLSRPIVCELIDGEWVRYDISSSSNPDFGGYGVEYDGYSVHYDGDGTYSYSFIVNMDDAKPRTFKIELEEIIQ